MKTKLFIVLLLAIYFSHSSCKKDSIFYGERLTEVLYPDSYLMMKLKYDANGKIISTLDGDTDSLFYNTQKQLIRYFDGSISYTFEYNTKGQIVQRIPDASNLIHFHPDTIEYRYDSRGRITQSISRFSDPYNNPQQSWIRTYSYNERNDIIEYNAIHPYYNQHENEKLAYDKGRNPMNLSNSILFFINEHFYEALNEHTLLRKDNSEVTLLYSYNYSPGMLPYNQTIKLYFPGQPINPQGYYSKYHVGFAYE